MEVVEVARDKKVVHNNKGGNMAYSQDTSVELSSSDFAAKLAKVDEEIDAISEKIKSTPFTEAAYLREQRQKLYQKKNDILSGPTTQLARSKFKV